MILLRNVYHSLKSVCSTVNIHVLNHSLSSILYCKSSVHLSLPSAFHSPGSHRGVNSLRHGFDVILILQQGLHLLLGFLDHILPGLHLVQVSFQGLVEELERHEVVLDVVCQPVASVS